MRGAVQRVKNASSKVIESAKSAVHQAAETLREHGPSTEQLRDAKDRSLEVVKSAGDMAKELVQEIVESKPFKDAAKGAIVGAVVAVPVPLVGPLFGGTVGALAALYFGQRAGGDSATVLVPAEGSEPYKLLRELEDLRRRKVLSRDQFEEQVRKVLDTWHAAQAAPLEPNHQEASRSQKTSRRAPRATVQKPTRKASLKK